MARENSWWNNLSVGPDCCPRRHEEAKANKTTLESPAFKKACQTAGIKPTRRQASKFLKKRGLAYSAR